MNPEEIKPDTGLCTILGHNAQTGYMRRYFNKIMKYNSKNATAIALNISDEHFDFTMSNVGQSKVDKMMIEDEFSQKILSYCQILDACAKEKNRVDFIEIKEGKIYGYCLDYEAEKLFDKPEFLDAHTLFVTKIMLLANRWFKTTIEKDAIPFLIENR